jgi:Family of unknown function (DUF6941)
VPELDYALVCDYVRAEGGLAHVISAGVDTIWTAEVPTGQNVGLLISLLFTRNECGRPHRLEVIFQDEDGERLAQISGAIEPQWPEGIPPGWRSRTQAGFNIGLPLPRVGLYAFELLVNDSNVKTIPLRVLKRETPEPGPAAELEPEH